MIVMTVGEIGELLGFGLVFVGIGWVGFYVIKQIFSIKKENKHIGGEKDGF